MIRIKQIEVGGFDSNYSYLLVDEKTAEASLVDPCGDTGLIQKAFFEQNGLKPRYILLTHGHGDHISGIKDVLEFFKAPVCAHPRCPRGADLRLSEGQKLDFGATFIECLYAPGHTDDSIVYHLGDDTAIFTGDTLFIGCCGYCKADKMFNTLRNVIFPLADSNEVYSGHNYGHCPHQPLGREKIENPYLSCGDFSTFSKALKGL